MLSWLNKDKGKTNQQENKENKENDNDSKETSPLTNDNIIPTPDNYPMHAAVLKKDVVELQKHIDNLPSFDPLIPDKMKPINQKDHHGYTALHLCVLTSWNEGVDLMLKCGASPTVRSRAGWTAIQETISTSQRELLKKCFARNMAEVREGLALRSPIIRKKLCEKDDFYVEIDWKFTSWIPFVSRFCPCDTFKIWKRGSDFRLDMTLIDFESFSWKRGHISFIFIMNKETDKAEFYVVNHNEKTKQVTNKQKELEESKNELEIDSNIEQLLQSEVVSPEVITNKIEITKSKTWMGYEKSMEINDKKCVLYELKNLIVLANKRDSHVPQQVKEERALAKQLFNQKIEASKKGEKVDFEIDTIQNIENNQKNDDNQSNDNQSSDTQSKDISIKKTKSISSIKNSIFGEIKKYEYEPYIPPKITLNEYFNVDKWQKHKMETMSAKMKKKKQKVTTQIMEERKDTFKINQAPSTTTTKSFKLNLAMAESFGVSIDEILAILEAAAPQSKLAAKLKEFLEIKMPRGFPIQLELPLFHVLKATVTFQNFEHINPDDDIFVIPEDYLLIDKEKDNK